MVKSDGFVTKEIAKLALDLLEIDALGLDAVDRKVLTCIIENFDGGPVGIETLAASTGEETSTIEDVYEPYLMQIGFINRTPRGRMITNKGRMHLGYESVVSADQICFESLPTLEEGETL